MSHVMLDLETLGTKPGASIRSIGAVVFDPFGDGIVEGSEFYRNISEESCVEAGLVSDPATVAWWSTQPQEARDALLLDPVPLAEAASGFFEWFLNNAGERVWAQGAAFDPPLWEAAVVAAGLRVPWKYWNLRDTRTVYDVCRYSHHKQPARHNALDDCVRQVACVQEALRSFKGAAR